MNSEPKACPVKDNHRKLFMTGASGFIGRAAVAYLQHNGYSITAWVRDVRKSRNLLGEGVNLIGYDAPLSKIRTELESSHSVINLSGKNLAGVRWNAQKKKDF